MADEYTSLHTLAGYGELETAGKFSTLAGFLLLEKEDVNNLAGIIEVQTEAYSTIGGIITGEATLQDTLAGNATLEKIDVLYITAGIITLETEKVSTLSGNISCQIEAYSTIAGFSTLEKEVPPPSGLTIAGILTLEMVDVLSTLAGNISDQLEAVNTLSGKSFLERVRFGTTAGKAMLETSAIKKTLACKITLERVIPPSGVNNTLAGVISLSVGSIDSAKRIAAILKFAQSGARAASYMKHGGNHVTQIRQILGQYTGVSPWDAAGIAKLIVDVVKNDPGE